jgi:hypothetical protein
MKGRHMTGPGETTTIIATSSRASGLLVPIITAVLVLALGCLLVSFTGNTTSDEEPASNQTSSSRTRW